MSNLATIVNNILADSGIDDINVVVTTGSYTNPSWIVSLPWTKITGTPTTLSGYGITNAYTKTETDTLLNAKLSLSGGTMTGPINLFASQFYEGGGLFALNANNSDLIGINGLYFNDLAETPSEGLNWYNTSTTWDSLWSASGVLYYTPNRTNNTIGTSYTVYHSGNLSSPVTGTGANTRVAYWTGSGTLSGEDSFAYDSANNRVRINASAFDSAGVAAKLIVSGVLNAGSDATVQIDGFVRIKDQLLIHNAANTAQDAYIQAVGQDVLTVGNKLLINTTTIGSYQLDVRSSASDVARFVAGSGDALVRIIADNYNTESDARLFLGENDTLGMTFEYDGQQNIGHIGMNDSVDPTGAFSKRISMPRSNTDTLFNAGNVGIGVTPTYKLDVSGTGRFSGDLLVKNTSTIARIDIEAPSANSKNIFFKSSGNADNSVRLAQNANTNDFIIATGDGTVSPTTRLTIASTGAATFSSSVTASGNILGASIIMTPVTANPSSTSPALYQPATGELGINVNGSERIRIASTGAATFSNSVGIGASPANTMLQVQGDWVSGFSTVRVQGSSANQAGYGLYNIAGTRVGVWAYTGSVIYFETETSSINMNFNPAGITSMTLEGNGNVSIGRLTSGLTRADVYLSPSSTNAQLYFGRLSSTNDDNTKVYFVNRTGTAAMFVDTGAQRVQIKSDTTPNYTAYDLFVSRGDQYGGGIDVQTGLVRFRGDDDWLYINRAGTDVITIDNNNRVGIGTTSNNGKLQITGSHVGGYGMLNMNSADSCIIAMDSSTSWDVRLRYKFQGVDYWFAGMVTDNTWRLTKGDNTAVLYATQGNNVYIPNGGLQIASEGGFTGSAKFLVGSFLSAGSSAIAQFNGFLRIKDQLIIHNTSNTGLETYLQCTGSNALTTGGSITATSFFESSDARLKSNINDLSIDVSSIKAKIYEKDGKTEIGYLAQDVENILSGAVSKRDNGYLDLSYRQVHTAKINALEQKIKELEKQLNNK